MKMILFAIAMTASLTSFAADKPASEASVRELINITDARKLLDSTYGQMDGMLEQAMKPAIGDKPANAEQSRLLAEFRAKTVELMRSEMGWDRIEPIYLDLYTKTFSQAEIDGMLAFYKSDVGKAVTAKLPQLTTGVTQSMMTTMQGFMPRLQKLVEEYMPKIKAAADQ